MKNFKKYALPIIYFALGILITSLVLGNGNKDNGNQHEDSHSSEWTCSMHPQIRQETEGDCPICGMDLIPALNSNDSSTGTFKMSEHAMELAGVQTTPITKGNVQKKIRLQGEIVPNAELVNTQAAYFAGRIEELVVYSEGEKVVKEQVLARIYSPELILTQQELLSAYSQREDNPVLYTSARKKLSLLNVHEEQIDNIIDTQTPLQSFEIRSMFDGYITGLHANQGDYVKYGQPLYDITDQSQLWVEFDAYEPDLPFIKLNQKLSFSIPAYLGKKFKAKIVWISPQVDPMKHTVTIRAEVSNQNNTLKPNMLAEGTLLGSIPGNRKALIIPKSAVLWTGDTSVAYVKTNDAEETEFEIREITLGETLDNFYILKKGIEEGEEVVTAGTFAVDASAQLMNKQSMMNPKHKEPSNNLSLQLSKFNRETLNKVLQKYFQLTTNLVHANPKLSQKSAEAMQKHISQLSDTGFYGDALEDWKTRKLILTKYLSQLVESQSIETQRQAFKPLSVQVIELAKMYKLNNKPMFVQFCPMADNDKGAQWLSNTKEILNPYFGDLMLECGETKEILGE
ncbi:MAG: efflux RND transporter periplasmic adaptor subunit [Candidatus Zophobacter franzmannii]|nr:efflux RND transporter periplasmic adaptor subunit [Candidatus Zophobacter franzmannii]